MKKLLIILLFVIIHILIISDEYVLLQTINYGTRGEEDDIAPHITDFNRNGIDEILMNTARPGIGLMQFYEFDPVNDSMELVNEINRGFLWAGGWGDYDLDGLYEIVGFSPDSQYIYTMEQSDSFSFPDTITWTEYSSRIEDIFSTDKLKTDSIDRIIKMGIIEGLGSDLGWGYYDCVSNDDFIITDTLRETNTIVLLNFVDFDNDSLLDLLIRTGGSVDSAIIIEEATDLNADLFIPFKAYPIVNESPRASKIVVLPDIDKDGEKEVGFTKSGPINPNPVYYFCIAEDTSGTGELVDIFEEMLIVETNNIIFTGTGVDYGDTDNDGEIEVVYCGGRHMEVWGCTGDNTFIKEYEFTDLGMNLLTSTVLCHDFNQNGIPEIIFTGGKGDSNKTYIIECRPLSKLDYRNPTDLGNETVSTLITDSVYLYSIDELPVIIDSMKLLKENELTLIEPTYPCSIQGNDSIPIEIQIYSDIETFITDTLIIYSDDWYGNVDTMIIYSGTDAEICIDSAIASDNRNSGTGIDYDDYVKIYFNFPIIPIDTSIIDLDAVLELNNSHNWYDGAGNTGQINYSKNNNEMVIFLSIETTLPTIEVGDTIYPDSISIKDERNYSYLKKPIVITGSFDPTGIEQPQTPNSKQQTDLTINYQLSAINLQYSIPDNQQTKLTIYDITGREITNKTHNKQGIYKINLSTYSKGIYFINLKTETNTISRKIIIF